MFLSLVKAFPLDAPENFRRRHALQTLEVPGGRLHGIVENGFNVINEPLAKV